MSVVTTVSAFYLPASVMVILYYKVFDGLKKRARFEYFLFVWDL